LHAMPTWFLRGSILALILPIIIWGCIPGFFSCAYAKDWHRKCPLQAWRIPMPRDWEWRRKATWFPMFGIFFVLQLIAASIWKLVLHIFLRKRFTGRLLVVPNNETDIYSRLWCVYEIFIAASLQIPVEVAHTLAPAGRCGTQFAECGKAADTQRIQKEIADASFSYAEIDRAVSHAISRWNELRVAFVYGYPILVFSWPLDGLWEYPCFISRFVSILCAIFITFALVVGQHWFIKRARGNLSTVELMIFCIACIVAGLLVQLAAESDVGVWLFLDGMFGLIFFACCTGLHRNYCVWGIGPILAVAAIVLCLAFFFAQPPSSWTFGKCYPAAIFVVMLVGSLIAPIYVLWSAGRRWGVRIRSCPPAQCCRR